MCLVFVDYTLFEMHKRHVSYSVAYPIPPNIIYASNKGSVNIYLRGRKDCAFLKLGKKFYCLTTPYLNFNYACFLVLEIMEA